MKRRDARFSKMLGHSEVLVAAAVFVLLLGVFVYAFAEYDRRSPSPGMSREVILDRVESSGSSISAEPMTVLTHPEEEVLRLVVADHRELRIHRVNPQGEILSTQNLDLDLGNADRIAGYHRESGEIVLFADEIGLRRLILSPDGQVLSDTVLVPRIDKFRGSGPALIVDHQSGIGLWDDRRGAFTESLSGPDTGRYAFAEDDDRRAVVIVEKQPNEDFDLRLYYWESSSTHGMDTERDKRVLTLPGVSNNETYRKLQDAAFRGGTLSLLFTMRDNRYGRNYITVRQIEPETGSLIREYQSYTPIYGGRFRLAPTNEGEETAIIRHKTVFGDNLVRCVLTGETGHRIEPLTKTRRLSVQSAYRRIGDFDTFFFSDLENHQRLVSFSSTHPKLVAASTRWTSADWGRIVGITATHGILALFLGAVFFMIAAPPPLILASLAERFFPKFRFRFPVYVGAGGVLYIGLKLFVSRYFLKGSMSGRFVPPWLGEEFGIYVFLVVTAVASYLYVSRSFAAAVRRRESVPALLTRFLILDTVVYSGSFLIYGITAMLIEKL